ncbi:hypothetical protein M1D93_01275 [Arthrobacter sp. Z1-9]
MATSRFTSVLAEATVPEFDSDCPLTADCLCGLYVRWGVLLGMDAKPDITFRSAMHCGADVDDSRLRIVGPAAADYILSSCPTAA